MYCVTFLVGMWSRMKGSIVFFMIEKNQTKSLNIMKQVVKEKNKHSKQIASDHTLEPQVFLSDMPDPHACLL